MMKLYGHFNAIQSVIFGMGTFAILSQTKLLRTVLPPVSAPMSVAHVPPFKRIL